MRNLARFIGMTMLCSGAASVTRPGGDYWRYCGGGATPQGRRGSAKKSHDTPTSWFLTPNRKLPLRHTLPIRVLLQ